LPHRLTETAKYWRGAGVEKNILSQIKIKAYTEQDFNVGKKCITLGLFEVEYFFQNSATALFGIAQIREELVSREIPSQIIKKSYTEADFIVGKKCITLDLFGGEYFFPKFCHITLWPIHKLAMSWFRDI